MPVSVFCILLLQLQRRLVELLVGLNLYWEQQSSWVSSPAERLQVLW